MIESIKKARHIILHDCSWGTI